MNGQRLDLCFTKGYLHQQLTAEASVLLNVTDNTNEHHIVNVTAVATSSHSAERDETHDHSPTDIILKVVEIDNNLLTPPTEVLAELEILPERRLKTLLYHPTPQIVSLDEITHSFTTFKPPPRMANFDKDDLLDIEDELEVLRMLEADAVALKAELAARKLVVNQRFQKHLANVPLKDLIEQCDGIMCAAKIIAGRLCDKMGVAAHSPPDYSEIDTHLQYMMSTNTGETGKSSEKSKDCDDTKESHDDNAVPSGQSDVNAQSAVSENGTTEGRPRFFAKKNLSNPLVIALEILASILGLTALCTFIHRKCMSMRTRVERAADKEERRNARAYRRAARRALMRKRWDNFVSAISCFGSQAEEKRTEDYEEKRALILQDAFLEQGLDLAEKGEVMEAEIRELRNAHDIVAGLIGVDEHRYDLVRHTPPPHAYNPSALSRRSTGSTLPSYTSESLPDYTSTPDSTEGSSRVANGFTNYTPATSQSNTRFSTAPSSTGSRRTGYTPVSSVIAISPRCSAETLRTRQSGDS